MDAGDERLSIQGGIQDRENNVVADQLSRPFRVIQGSEDGTWLRKSRDEIQELQREEPRWREMVDYLEGGGIPRSKHPRATLDQFALEQWFPNGVPRHQGVP